jgi:predicted NAD-dependent protein-ADP-ribosyltransferase YbiA (DUF1768 family)
VLFKDEKIAKAVLQEEDAHKINQLGKKINKIDKDLWASKCEEIVLKCNQAKVCLLLLPIPIYRLLKIH